MYRLHCSLAAVFVLQCVHSFILYNELNCPTTCTCTETKVDCTADTLHAWPGTLQNGELLQAINLQNNPNLGNIPRGAFDSFQHSLLYLNLQNTGLTEVPQDIKHLQNLTKLFLSDNVIGDIEFPDDVFGKGPMAIEVLYLWNTSLTKIPLALCSLSKLQMLDLDANDIKTISDEQALCIRNVTRLQLSNCAFSWIPSSIRLLTHLRELYLSGNPLTTIEHFDFNSLANLMYLYIENCEINYISPGAFQWTPSLLYISLHHNNLTEIPVAFRLLDRNMHIDISRNPVHCSCDMKWVKDWMKNSTAETVYGYCKNHEVPIVTYIGIFLNRCPP